MINKNNWIISKDFNFDYSHRVWVQSLRNAFCAIGDTATKCRFQHGHTGTVTIFVEGGKLNPQHMLCDFKELGFAKDFIDEHIDHKFIIDINDPLFTRLTGLIIDLKLMRAVIQNDKSRTLPIIAVKMPGTDYTAGYKVDVSSCDSLDYEYYGSYFIVNFCPTSERLAAWVFNWVEAKMKLINVITSKVIWKETPKTQAIFSKE